MYVHRGPRAALLVETELVDTLVLDDRKRVLEYQPLPIKSMQGIVFFVDSQRTVIYNRKGRIGVINTHEVGEFERGENVEDIVLEWTSL
jgi:hypothetical protein